MEIVTHESVRRRGGGFSTCGCWYTDTEFVLKGLQIMCGIAGFVNDMPIDVKCPVLQRMTDMIAHRGPDSEGHYIDEHAALGHRRLSIIDLGGGQQPIYNEDGSKVITLSLIHI